jgi:predicted TIM-barrel fold metal-dependent hydrolase
VDLLGRLPFVDHHCHSVAAGPLDQAGVEARLGEATRPAPPGSAFDTSVGLAVRRWCAPLLDLPAGAPADVYCRRRLELGPNEVNARLLAAGSPAALLVDSGLRASGLARPEDLGRWSGAAVHEIVRLETVAEDVAAARVRPERFADAFAEALDRRLVGAVGVKSVVGYRAGLDLDWSRPAPSEVATAAAAWLSSVSHERPPRLAHPVLLRHVVWAGLDRGLPLQLHTGLGDSDQALHRCNPSLLDGLFRATADTGAPIVLLHCYPYHREAGYLANVWPHVYLDVGLAIPQVGHRAGAVLAETLELGPWSKVLYSTDAFGLAELYALGGQLWRVALGEVLASLAADGWEEPELLRLARLVSCDNACGLYRLAQRSADDPAG